MSLNKPKEELPREKLINHGVQTLTLSELLAILIRTGSKSKNVLNVADDLLNSVNNNLYTLSRLSVRELSKNHGIASTKAVTILAALELGSRLNETQESNTNKITSSNDAYLCFKQHFINKIQEEFWVLLLARNNKVLGKELISKGGWHDTMVDPKIVFHKALEYKASQVILAHNHPSGNIEPSSSDLKLTQRIKSGGNILGINVIDHIIIGENKYYSFVDHSKMDSLT